MNEYHTTQQKTGDLASSSQLSIKKKSNSRPTSHMRQRLEKAYKQYCDNAELQDTSNGRNLNTSQPKVVVKAKGSSKV